MYEVTEKSEFIAALNNHEVVKVKFLDVFTENPETKHFQAAASELESKFNACARIRITHDYYLQIKLANGRIIQTSTIQATVTNKNRPNYVEFVTKNSIYQFELAK